MVLDLINVKLGFHENVIRLGVENNSSVHADNGKKDILILGKGPAQGLDDTELTAEAEYSIIFSEQKKKNCLSLHYNGSNSFLFVNGIKMFQSKRF